MNGNSENGETEHLKLRENTEINGKRENEEIEKAPEAVTIEVVSLLGSIDGKFADENAKRIAYRHRFLHTACVCFSMFALGWRNGLFGPTLPDLRLIINEDLATASWLLTAVSLGGLLGSICGGFAYDRFNKIGVFIFIVCGLGIAAAVAPWCYHFAAMFVVHVFHGAFASALDTAATADMTIIWRQKAGPFMQAVHGLFSVGAIISPFVSEPFMAKRIYLGNSGTVNISSTDKTVSTYTYEEHSFEAARIDYSSNLSSSNLSRISLTKEIFDFPNSSYNGSLTTDYPITYIYGKTSIYIPYFTASLVCLIAVSLYLVVHFIYGNVYRLPTESCVKSTSTASRRQYFLGKKMKIIFTILLALTLTCYVMSERSFIGFLMTFLITELQWSKAGGSSASAVFWIAFATGRLTGIVIVKFVHLSILIIAFYIIITTGAVLLWVAVIYNINILIWVSVATVGYGMSVVFASIFLWLSEHIRRLTGKMASILFIFFSTGGMIFPILTGYLMDKVSQMWFIYLQLFIVCVMGALFIFVLIFFNILKKSHEHSSEKHCKNGLVNS